MEADTLKVAAVIVAFDRDNLLQRALSNAVSQTRKADIVVVVDNANLETTRLLVESMGAIYLNGALENGSAGGFAIGISFALTEQCDYVWTLDDDGYPDSMCLSTLIQFSISNQLGVSSPLSLSQEDHSQTANPYLFGIRKVTSVEQIQKKNLHWNKAQFYNGMLMSRETIELIGLPKKELFLRGDEMDYLYRATRANVRMALVTEAIFYHPSGAPEFANSRNSIFGVVIPTSEVKKYYQFRNRGYLIREYRLYSNAIYDWIRYPFFFIFYPGGNLKGFLEWKKLWFQGFRQEITPYNQN